MSYSISHRRLPTILLALLLVLIGSLAPQPISLQAQVANGSGFASAVPCMSGTPTYATTTMANTIVGGGTPKAAASDPALLQITSSSASTLAPLGTSSVAGQNTPVVNGIGSTYGLAYDDGSSSGVRRLFAAAYLKRSVAFGSGGAGAIYEYRFATGVWSLATSVPGAWSGAGRASTDTTDSAIFDQVGKQGLGDLELSPDGRTLYAMNLTSRQIERYDISGGALIRQAPLSIPFSLISADPAVQADLRPFALGFYPLANFQGGSDAPMVVGIVDSAERSPSKNSGPWVYPKAYVFGYNTGTGSWGFAVQQPLTQSDMFMREALSSFFPKPAMPGYEQSSGWNPWQASKATLHNSSPMDGAVRFPQPMLTDITFSRDGQMMYVGLRDRTGDQLFAKSPPAGERVVIGQGDVLTYKLVGGAWQLQGDRFGDTFDDNTHAYPGSTPAHIENFMGSMAISMGGSGPSAMTEQVMATSLLGASSSGVRTYAANGGAITTQQTIIPSTLPAGGKASALGDVEVLCSYALIGGRVWQDSNYNGVQEASEPPFVNVGLELFQGSSGTSLPTLASVSTDAAGNYLFAVPPNTPVNIRIAASSRLTLAAQGWYFTRANAGGNDELDSDVSRTHGYIEFAGQNYGVVGGGITGIAIPMPINRSDQRNFDLGLTRVQPVGEIGDRVWDDTNHNGVQNTGEPGHAGISATLAPDPSSAAILPNTYPRSTTTNAAGNYSFRNLPPGRYRVTFGVPPAPFSATLRNQGVNDAADSDVDATTGYATPYVTLDDTINTTLDFGLYGGTPDVWVSKSGPAQALVGGAFSYTLSYGNAGALPAAGVSLVDTLPSGVSYVSASSAPSSVSGQRLTWSLGTLAAGASGSITLNVRAPASLGAAVSQAITNQATISTSTAYDPPGNNSSSSSGTVVRPEVSIVKSGPGITLVGDEYNYTLSYANSGSIAAASVVIADTLPTGVTFARFIQNPSAACTYTAATRRVSCSFASLAAGVSGSVVFVAKADPTAAASVVNTATISTATSGDGPSNNSSTATTIVQFPNPGVTVSISPSPFPVGTSGNITAAYINRGSGVARSTTLTLTLPAGVILGTLPSSCSYASATRVLTCPLGDLAVGASGSRVIPVSLPATFAANSLTVSASIATTTPERAADLVDNTASASVNVVRPNVFVQAAGPSSIVGQGSAFWYTVDYGNQYRANPSLTRAADSVVLQATLPPDVTFVNADRPPSSVSGQTLTWSLGTLAPNVTGQIHIVVQTSVPAGATLHFSADISTTTPGDDPGDNHAEVDTTVVQPPDSISQGAGDLRLAIHSDLDPNSQDSNATNGVYVSDGSAIAWPAGEVLDFTPRLAGLDFPDEPLPFPYEYRARVVGWSLVDVTVNGATYHAQAADSRGLAGCRAGARPSAVPQLLAGCTYAYLGGGSRSEIQSPAPLSEAQLATQAHIYWTQPPAPRMRSDVYLYTLDPLESAHLAVQVEVEVWIVNAYPGTISGMPLPEIPVVPLPDPGRQLLSQDFTVNLLVPRSVIAPGSN